MLQHHRHLAAYGCAIQADRLLVVEKSRGPYAGRLCLPGGGLHHGEPPVQALRRELDEETGLVLSGHQLLRTVSHTCEYDPRPGVRESLHHVALIYRVHVSGDVRSTGDPDRDVASATWLHRDELESRPLSPILTAVLDDAFGDPDYASTLDLRHLPWRAGVQPPRWSRLHGGTTTEVWTTGEQVRRTRAAGSGAVHQLLEHLEAHHLDGVPRFLRADDDVEVLTFLPGRAIHRPWPPVVWSSRWMKELGAWLRASHEASRGFRLSGGATFAWGPSEPAPGHVVTHGDLAPWNMIENGGRFAGVIDWDLARYGLPLDDLTEAAFEAGPLRRNDGMLPGGTTPEMILSRVEALCRGYGEYTVEAILAHVEPLYLERRQEQERLAAEGEPPFTAMVDAGNLQALSEDLQHCSATFGSRGHAR